MNSDKNKSKTYDLPINLHIYKINEFGYFKKETDDNDENIESFIDYDITKGLKKLEEFYKETPNLENRKKTYQKEDIYLHFIKKIENQNLPDFYIIRFAISNGFSYKIGAYVDIKTGKMSLPNNKNSNDIPMKFSYLYIIPDKNILISFRIAGEITGKSTFEKYTKIFFKEYEEGGYVRKKAKTIPMKLKDVPLGKRNTSNFEFKNKEIIFKVELDSIKIPAEDTIKKIDENFNEIKKVTYQLIEYNVELIEKEPNFKEEKKLFKFIKDNKYYKKETKGKAIEEIPINFNKEKNDFLQVIHKN